MTNSKHKQITIVTAVIKNDKREVLLAKRHQPEIPEVDGKWEFAGGGIEFDEDPENAIKREVKEELGVDVEVIRLIPKVISDTQEFKDGNKLHVLVLTYECKIISGTPKAHLNEEIGEIRYVPMQEIKNYNTFNNILKTVEFLQTNN